jgi:membrane protein YdbS with pleckstrin-like domain
MALAHTSHLVDLEPGEEVVREVRRHMIVFYARVLFIVFLFFVPLFLSPFITLILNKIVQAPIGGIVFGFVFTIWLLALWVLLFLQWTDYYLDVWVITNKRMFDIDQKGIFTREISVFRLENMQDITIEVKGLLATFLKFGTVHIHTAGESHDFTILDAADPSEVKNTIMRAHSMLLEEGERGPAPAPTDPLEQA